MARWGHKLVCRFKKKGLPLHASMYMKPSYRRNRKGEEYVYYRLCDTYKDPFGIARRRDLINLGRRDDLTIEEAQLAAKAAKENSMYDQFTKRFIDEQEKIQASLSKKHGTKKTDKVNERIGRAREKYPSVAKYYNISYTEVDGKVTSISWKLKDGCQPDEKAGVYFLQTNIDGKDSKTIWTIYNILKEVESSFRCMKSDLNLRPVFHKKDTSCLAHLHLGVLAYWVVATIRYELKQKGMNKTWSQILDIMVTQKSVSSEMQNLKGEEIHTLQCSEPNEEVMAVLDKVNISYVPYKPIKSVWAQIGVSKNETTENQGVP